MRKNVRIQGRRQGRHRARHAGLLVEGQSISTEQYVAPCVWTTTYCYWSSAPPRNIGTDDKGDVEGVMWYNGNKTEEKLRSWFDNKGFLFWGGAPHSEFPAGQSNVVWVSAHNQFFALVAMPAAPAPKLVSRPVLLPRPKEGQASFTSNPAPKGSKPPWCIPKRTYRPARPSSARSVFMPAQEYQTLRASRRVQQQRGPHHGLWRLLRLLLEGAAAGHELAASCPVDSVWLGDHCHHAYHEDGVLADHPGPKPARPAACPPCNRK